LKFIKMLDILEYRKRGEILDFIRY